MLNAHGSIDVIPVPVRSIVELRATSVYGNDRLSVWIEIHSLLEPRSPKGSSLRIVLREKHVVRKDSQQTRLEQIIAAVSE